MEEHSPSKTVVAGSSPAEDATFTKRSTLLLGCNSMKKYKVKFFYLATGMDGVPEIQYFDVMADNEDDAKEKASFLFSGDDALDERTLRWVKRCMSIVH